MAARMVSAMPNCGSRAAAWEKSFSAVANCPLSIWSRPWENRSKASMLVVWGLSMAALTSGGREDSGTPNWSSTW